MQDQLRMQVKFSQNEQHKRLAVRHTNPANGPLPLQRTRRGIPHKLAALNNSQADGRRTTTTHIRPDLSSGDSCPAAKPQWCATPVASSPMRPTYAHADPSRSHSPPQRNRNRHEMEGSRWRDNPKPSAHKNTVPVRNSRRTQNASEGSSRRWHARQKQAAMSPTT